MHVPSANRHGRSAWPYLYGCLLIAYAAVFIAVLWIGAGFGAPTTPAIATQPTAAPDVAATRPAATVIAATAAPPTATARPTDTPAPLTATPAPTPDPNVDFRVPLTSSNTGVLGGHRVSIQNITDDAQPTAPAGRAPAGMKYIAVEVRIENIGGNPTVLGAWRLRTAAGQEADATAVRGFPDLLTGGTPLPPGASVAGTVVFAVPSAAKIAWIRYAPDPAHSGALYFDAG